MIRWILSLLVVLLMFSTAVPTAMAQEAQVSPITEEQLQQGEALAQKALEATDKGDFVQAETYWSQLIAQLRFNSITLPCHFNNFPGLDLKRI